MERLAVDPALRDKMGAISAQKIAGHTPERWAEDFETAIEEIMQNRQGRR